MPIQAVGLKVNVAIKVSLPFQVMPNSGLFWPFWPFRNSVLSISFFDIHDPWSLILSIWDMVYRHHFYPGMFSIANFIQAMKVWLRLMPVFKPHRHC